MIKHRAGAPALPTVFNTVRHWTCVERTPLGCPKFDRLLGGGIESGCVTMVYGEAGAGKTNVCLQVARNVAESGRKVIYLDTEGLSKERLAQLFKGNEDAIRNILISEVHSLEEQTDRIEMASKIVSSGVSSLIIIDSLTMFYRLRHDESKARNEFVRQTEMLLEIARKYDVSVLITSQVYSSLTSGRVEFLGGHALNHNAKTILRLEKLDNGRRKAVIVKHRSLPEGRSTYYIITETGIEDA